MLFDFLLFEKMDQRNCIKFWVKNLIKRARIFEKLTVTFGESTTELKFNCGITDLRKAEKMSMKLLLIAIARQQPMKTLKQ